MPTWLTIELGLIPVVLAGLSGLVWLVRLEAVHEAKQRDPERDDRARQAKHNDRLYDELRTINKNLHLIMGKLQITPLER